MGRGLDLTVARDHRPAASLSGRGHTKSAASGVGNHHVLDSGHLRLQPGQFRLEMDVFLRLFGDDDRGRDGGDLGAGDGGDAGGGWRGRDGDEHFLFGLGGPLGGDARVTFIRGATVAVVPG